MSRYLSIDTEATGLREDTLLIQIAVVPTDPSKGEVREDLGWETLVHCPSFAELKPKLSEWVIENMEPLIHQAHEKGIPVAKCRDELDAYLTRPEIKEYFGGERPILLGKSLSALDIPLMNRSFGWDWMQKSFHHHTVDVTCMGRTLVDAGYLPEGSASTTKLMQYFKIREVAEHTALQDAVDMAHIYSKMVEMVKRPG